MAPPRTRCVCEGCGGEVGWVIPAGLTAVRFLAPIPCPHCGKRKLRADIPSEREIQGVLPGLR